MAQSTPNPLNLFFSFPSTRPLTRPSNPGAHNFKKDIAVVLSLLIGVGGCYFAYRQQKVAHRQMQKVMKDLSSLQTAEDTLTQIQLEFVGVHGCFDAWMNECMDGLMYEYFDV